MRWISDLGPNVTRLSKNASWLFGAYIISSGLGFVQSIILAHALGVESYGFLILVIAYSTTINQLTNFRVWEITTKYFAQFLIKGEKQLSLAVAKTCYVVNITSGLVSFGIVLLTAQLASKHVIHRPQSALLIAVFSVSLLVSTLDSTSMAILRVFNEYGRLAFSSVLYSVALTTGIGLIAAGTPKPEAIAGLYIVAAVIRAMLLNIRAFSLLQRQLGSHWWNARMSILRSYREGIISFLASSSVNTLLKSLQANLDVVLLGFWWGPLEVVYYKVAKVIVGLIGVATNPLYEAIYPELSMLWSAGQLEGFKALIIKCSKIASTAALMATGVVLLFASHIILRFYGDSFLAASSPLKILTAGTGIALAGFWGHPALLAMGQPWHSTFIFSSSMGLQLLALAILVPTYGPSGAALAYTLFYVSWTSLLLLSLWWQYAGAAVGSDSCETDVRSK